MSGRRGYRGEGRGGALMNACTDREKIDLLAVISQRIEQRERLEKELGVDLHKIAGLATVEDLKLGLEVLRQELARPRR
jgi:hypothetical protein